MNTPQQANELSGIQLMRLMDTHLFQIIRKEHDDNTCIRLYGIGGYWVAFEQSAYLLCRLFPSCETAIAAHAEYPFPVIMASIPDEELRNYGKQHIFRRNDPDYKELIASEISAKQYQTWHKNEVQTFR